MTDPREKRPEEPEDDEELPPPGPEEKEEPGDVPDPLEGDDVSLPI